MGGNKIVVYKEPGVVAVEDHDAPKLEVPAEVAEAMGMSRKADHGVILRNVSTNICGSDQHMVRGRTTAPAGQTLGHEITGEIVEKGQRRPVPRGRRHLLGAVQHRLRPLPQLPRGADRHLPERQPRPRPGSAYGYVDMGGWEGGQAEYVMVPFADFNLLKFPDRDQALEKILDLTMLSDIFPTGYHGAYTAGVTTGSTVYVAGAGPVGLAAAYSSLLLGAAVVIVGDLNADRLAQARSFGCETIDISQDATLEDQVAQILGNNEVDCAVDAVGFEATGHGKDGGEAPAAVLNSIMSLTRAGGSSASPGCTSRVTRAPPTPTPRKAPSRSGSGWAGPRATRSPPASARC